VQHSAFPSGGAFGIVGVNGGLPYSANACLGSGDGPSELAWAGLDAQLYANTADPGPALSSHWPNGETSPKQCNTATNPGSGTPECHYDYGWNAAADSYENAVKAYVALGWAASGATRTPVANQWWLDVETANSWTSTPSVNMQELQGEADFFASVGAAGVGFYSSSSAWQTITGGTTAFADHPTWFVGASSLTDAQAQCGGSGFTGGGVALVQFRFGSFDGDYRCGSEATLSFATLSQPLTAGAASAPMSVQLSQPASAAVVVSVSSSSAAGSFSTSSAGPWSASLSLALPVGTSASTSFYYIDNDAGTPTLTASTSGHSSTTQTETVTAAALASISVSPGSAKLRIGASRAFSATGTDRYGNAVPVTPNWSVSPAALGRFLSNPGNPTSFRSSSGGSGTITASVSGISAAVSVSVAKKRRGGGTGLAATAHPSAKARSNQHVQATPHPTAVRR
jgi:hypothetical protein